MGRTCIIAHSQWHGLILQKLPYLYDSSRRGHDVVKSIYFFVYEMVSFLANHINCFFGVSQSVVLWGFPNIFGSASAGDSQSIWNINSLRVKSVKHYSCNRFCLCKGNYSWNGHYNSISQLYYCFFLCYLVWYQLTVCAFKRAMLSWNSTFISIFIVAYQVSHDPWYVVWRFYPFVENYIGFVGNLFKIMSFASGFWLQTRYGYLVAGVSAWSEAGKCCCHD